MNQLLTAMKKFLSIIVALTVGITLLANDPQRVTTDDFFKTYAGTAGTESTMLGTTTLRALSEKKGISRRTAKLLKGLDRIWAISASADNEEFLMDARKTIDSRKDYQLISNTDRDGKHTSFYMSEHAPKSLIMISVTAEKVSYMEIRGEFTLLDFGNLSEIGIR